MSIPFVVVGLALAWFLLLPTFAVWLGNVLFAFDFKQTLTIVLTLWLCVHAIVGMFWVVKEWNSQERQRQEQNRRRALGK